MRRRIFEFEWIVNEEHRMSVSCILCGKFLMKNIQRVQSDNFVLSMNDLRRHAVSERSSGERPAGLRPSRWWRLAALAGLVACAGSLAAQHNILLPSDRGQTGTGAQVRTGTSSGLDTDTRLENLLADHQYPQVEAELGDLPPKQAQMYRGILANRDNDVKTSIELLEPLVDEVSASGDATAEKLVRKALAEDYLREGDWTRAAAAYQQLATRLEGKLSRDEQDEIEMPLQMLPLAVNHPPMTVDPCDPFEIQVSRNLLGLTDLPVFIDARPHSWLLDPTAPFNLISRSLAKEAGLKVSEETATIHSLRGNAIQVHSTVIPRFTISGQLTFHDMTAFVFDDADYYFPQLKYQVQGVLGYAALQALGSLTVTDNDTVFARPARQISPPANDDKMAGGVRFFLDGDQMILALGASGSVVPGGAERMYVVDAAGQQTYLTSRYYAEHSGEFNGQKLQLFSLIGQPLIAPVPSYTAETVTLAVGTIAEDVHYITVLTQPLGSAARDDVYGILGVDALEQLGTYTFDYRTMRFNVKPH
jgi:hypothetical protein